MHTYRRLLILLGLSILLITLASCSQALPTTTVQPTAYPTPTQVVEERIVELEWPANMRLGDSDVVRLALLPSKEGYTLATEFPEHQAQTQTVHVPRPGGYDLFAVARLDGVGFQIEPAGDQEQYLPPGDAIAWRWSLTPRNPGQQRLSVALRLRWVPLDGATGLKREFTAYSKGLDVQVTSILGLSHSQALITGLLGVIFGGGLSLLALVIRPRPTSRPVRQPALRTQIPNPDLGIEPRPGLKLSTGEQTLLQSLFQRYTRLVVEKEFHSGYSGARTFLALPIRADGRADAYTIVKLGEEKAICREFENYEIFVKDTLPPVTARIQHPPVSDLPAAKPGQADSERRWRKAALQYTFIGIPGSMPASLRQTLLAHPDPLFLNKLFDTFGPNWWMQRQPYTFRLATEYDRLLPSHLVLEPASGKGIVLDGRTPPSETHHEIGDLVTVQNFQHAEVRQDGQILSLRGEPAPGQPPLRVQWRSHEGLEGRQGSATGRVIATRMSLLRGFVSGFDLLDLPDPLNRLTGLLDESITGSRSIIHGDLNLENILVGPGEFVWLIDFAQTREGHPLYDFARLHTEIIAHILAARIATPTQYLALIQGHPDQRYTHFQTLIATLQEIAGRCLFNPSQWREYELALYFACLGALKFSNLEDSSKHLLYLTAANLVQSL